MPADQTVVMEDVRLIFRNFTGKEGEFNREGDRNFGVILPPDVAEAMERDGWNVKWLEPREEGEERTPWLPVKVAYGKGRPPKITVLTETHTKVMNEETVEQLDWVDVVTVDLIVRPYHYEVRGNTGIAAYLQSMFITIEEDALDRKYADRLNQAPGAHDQ